jgi:hypothetical protein
VRADAERPSSRGLGDLGGEGLAGRAVPAGDDDVGARGGEAERHGPAEAAAASGDQGDPAAEVEGGGGCGHVVSWSWVGGMLLDDPVSISMVIIVITH